MGKSAELAAARAQVLLVYPGPSSHLEEHAEAFVRGKSLPDNFSFVIDPDYAFTNRYGLRWEASGETAYPSTFVIDPKGKVVFAKTSGSPPSESTGSEIVGMPSIEAGTTNTGLPVEPRPTGAAPVAVSVMQASNSPASPA